MLAPGGATGTDEFARTGGGSRLEEVQELLLASAEEGKSCPPCVPERRQGEREALVTEMLELLDAMQVP